MIHRARQIIVRSTAIWCRCEPFCLLLTAETLFLRPGRADDRLGVGHAGGRIRLTDREISENDPIFFGIPRLIPEDRRIGRAQFGSVARVMRVGFPRQLFEGKSTPAK